jgi:cytochrome c biogenesis protein CcmG, thiol:disulfide interchange protein DsbE
MRVLLCFAFLNLCFFSFGQTPSKSATIDFDSLMNAKTSQILGRSFPSFVAANEKGKINNDSLAGKVVLINFWFEGCHPCVAEFPALNQLAEKLKGYKDFEFISFTWDNADAINRVKEKYNLQFKVFSITENECSRLNQNSAFPTTIILDRRGIIRYWTMGGTIDPKEATEFVMSTLLPNIEKEL